MVYPRIEIDLLLTFAFSNPNAAEHAHGKTEASREKSRFRSLVWDQYDPVHQKYLEIGKIKISMHKISIDRKIIISNLVVVFEGL